MAPHNVDLNRRTHPVIGDLDLVRASDGKQQLVHGLVPFLLEYTSQGGLVVF